MTNNFKKGLIALGVTSVIAGGILLYNQGGEYLTYEEMNTLIRAYEVELEEIREDCDNDIRCWNVEGEKQVNFGKIQDVKEVKTILDTWVEEKVSSPNKYKLVPVEL